MKFPKRKSPRLPKYDYASDNYYFVTICTHNKKCIFGKPQELSRYGKIVEQHILALSDHFNGVHIDQYVVMPNHIHLILVLENEQNPNCSQIIALFKSGVSRQIHSMVQEVKLWQRSYHDHVIRNQYEYEKIWLYIEANPMQWEKDCFYIDSTI